MTATTTAPDVSSEAVVRNDAIVLFGASGDLAKKMTFISLYHLSRRNLLNMPIIGVAFFPVQTWLLQQKRGLQRGIWLALHLMLGGTVIRAVPIIVTQSSGWVPVPLTVNGTVANLPPGEEPPFAQT